MYDPRIGKFLSVDPIAKSYPWYTPYQFAGNSPIQYIDLDGLEPAVPPGAKGVTYNPESSRDQIEQKSISNNAKLARGILVGSALAPAIYADITLTGGQVSRTIATGMTIYTVSEVYEHTNRNSNQKDPEIRAENERNAKGAVIELGITLGLGKLLDNVSKAVSRTVTSVNTKILNYEINQVEKHLSQARFLTAGEMDAGNRIMIDRLRRIAKGEMQATETDINFFKHELTESQLMKKGMSYEEAHAKSLQTHGIPNDENAALKLHTKEALKASDDQFRKAVESGKHK